jgi:hypothetical protein
VVLVEFEYVGVELNLLATRRRLMGRAGGRDMLSRSRVLPKLISEVGRYEYTLVTDDSSCRLAKREMEVVSNRPKARSSSVKEYIMFFESS